VRTGNLDIIVVPNTKITSGILVNHSLPSRRTLAEVAVPVAHEADAEQVRRIALEEAVATEGVRRDFEPVFLCDPGVLPTHSQFKVIVQVEDWAVQGRVQSDIRMRLLARFRAEGVPLPDLSAAHANRG
jgi:small-conductance mechanosensitive channel